MRYQPVRVVRICALISFVYSALVFLIACWPAVADQRPRRIVLLEGLTATQPAGVRTLEAFKNRLKERGVENIEMFIEFLELGRFPGQAHETRTAHFLKEKYSENPPDLLIPISRGALAFLLQYRSTIAPNTRIVYCCTAASAVTAMNVPRDVIGVVTEYNWLQTLALAERLQPDARNLVVISGASDFDRAWQEDARRQIEGHLQRYSTRYLAGLPYEELLQEVSHLSRDTIVLLVPVFEDGSGRPRVPPEVAADVARVSSAPVYAPAATFFGLGIVGGYMDSFEAHGTAAADLALEILSGRDPATLPAVTEPPHKYQIDARQLARWQLSESNLPSAIGRSIQGAHTVGALSLSCGRGHCGLRATERRRHVPPDSNAQTQASRDFLEGERRSFGVRGDCSKHRNLAPGCRNQRLLVNGALPRRSSVLRIVRPLTSTRCSMPFIRKIVTAWPTR